MAVIFGLNVCKCECCSVRLLLGARCPRAAVCIVYYRVFLFGPYGVKSYAFIFCIKVACGEVGGYGIGRISPADKGVTGFYGEEGSDGKWGSVYLFLCSDRSAVSAVYVVYYVVCCWSPQSVESDISVFGKKERGLT